MKKKNRHRFFPRAESNPDQIAQGVFLGIIENAKNLASSGQYTTAAAYLAFEMDKYVGTKLWIDLARFTANLMIIGGNNFFNEGSIGDNPSKEPLEQAVYCYELSVYYYAHLGLVELIAKCYFQLANARANLLDYCEGEERQHHLSYLLAEAKIALLYFKKSFYDQKVLNLERIIWRFSVADSESASAESQSQSLAIDERMPTSKTLYCPLTEVEVGLIFDVAAKLLIAYSQKKYPPIYRKIIQESCEVLEEFKRSPKQVEASRLINIQIRFERILAEISDEDLTMKSRCHYFLMKAHLALALLINDYDVSQNHLSKALKYFRSDPLYPTGYSQSTVKAVEYYMMGKVYLKFQELKSVAISHLANAQRIFRENGYVKEVEKISRLISGYSPVNEVSFSANISGSASKRKT